MGYLILVFLIFWVQPLAHIHLEYSEPFSDSKKYSIKYCTSKCKQSVVYIADCTSPLIFAITFLDAESDQFTGPQCNFQFKCNARKLQRIVAFQTWAVVFTVPWKYWSVESMWLYWASCSSVQRDNKSVWECCDGGKPGLVFLGLFSFMVHILIQEIEIAWYGVWYAVLVWFMV